ncbi:hypothetical protein LX36DRAFT_621846 [Colletotrichum falcatum]|nr:hypothetical protein LX36DRAFT_621846 [Colletotrichum falcatum]
METKGKSPEQNARNASKSEGNRAQTDGKDDMEQLVKKTQSLGISAPPPQAKKEWVAETATWDDVYVGLPDGFHWELVALKRVVELSNMELYGNKHGRR